LADQEILALGIVVCFVFFVYMVYKDYNYRKNSRSFYLDTVIAYKVGKIIKTAEEHDIKLVYPSEKDDFIENLDGRIVDDLNKEDAG